MPLLNLLTENFKPKDEGKDGSAVFVAAGVFILLASAAIYSGIYFTKQSALGKLAAAESEVKEVEEKIEEEINKSETLLAESRAKSIKSVLSKHPYFSRAVKMIQGKLIEGVYLDSFELSGEVKNKNNEGNILSLKIDVIAKSYSVIIEQIVAWRNSFWIEEVSIGKISTDQEGKISLSVDMEIKKDIIFYHEPYWDYGLAILSSKTNRHLKINDYDAVFKKAGEGNEDKIEINFSGVAYNKEALALFENNFKNDSSAENVFVSYDLSKKDNFERINFKGSATVDYEN